MQHTPVDDLDDGALEDNGAAKRQVFVENGVRLRMGFAKGPWGPKGPKPGGAGGAPTLWVGVMVYLTRSHS
jgi:hypothetical protein